MVLTFYRFIYECLFVYTDIMEVTEDGQRKQSHITKTNTLLRYESTMSYAADKRKLNRLRVSPFNMRLHLYIYEVMLYYHVNSILSALPVIALAWQGLVSIETIKKTLYDRVHCNI